jgi:hypothetical protein
MKKLTLLLAALFCMSGLSTTADAIAISIGVGDQPYYVHGPGYWAGGAYYVWIPGHWCGWRYHRHIWCHGHYALR